jgi:hypothetical protein
VKALQNSGQRATVVLGLGEPGASGEGLTAGAHDSVCTMFADAITSEVNRFASVAVGRQINRNFRSGRTIRSSYARNESDAPESGPRLNA